MLIRLRIILLIYIFLYILGDPFHTHSITIHGIFAAVNQFLPWSSSIFIPPPPSSSSLTYSLLLNILKTGIGFRSNKLIIHDDHRDHLLLFMPFSLDHPKIITLRPTLRPVQQIQAPGSWDDQRNQSKSRGQQPRSPHRSDHIVVFPFCNYTLNTNDYVTIVVIVPLSW